MKASSEADRVLLDHIRECIERIQIGRICPKFTLLNQFY